MSSSDPGLRTFANDKERFDHCIAMLKAYYEALEGRLGTTVGFFVLIAGWLITSESARKAIAGNRSLLVLAIVCLSLMMVFFAGNVLRWVKRWREIRATLDSLGYMEPRFYARYDLPRWTPITYITPVFVLGICLILFMIFITIRA